MTTDGDWELIQKLEREQREGELVRARIVELHESPIQGNFDLPHLQAVHAYIFQDLPEHQPGTIRERTENHWVKDRALEGKPGGYYANRDIEAKITTALDAFGGPDTIKGQTPDVAAARLAGLYGDLDYAHGFYEGNSRTLREFTRELALAAGFELDWIKTGTDAAERNALYLARDLAVLERAFPDLTPERAMQTESVVEYEASFVIEGLRKAVGDQSLEAIIRADLGPAPEREHDELASRSDDLSASVAGELSVLEPSGWDQDEGSRLDQDRMAEGRDGADIGTHGAIMVMDNVGQILGKLADIVADILSFGATASKAPPENSNSHLAQLEARQRAATAITNMRESMERGEGLNIADVRNLTPEHLTNLASKGDDYIRMLVRDTERDRGSERDYGWDRDR